MHAGEADAWTRAWKAVCETVDLVPPDNDHTVHRFAAELVARGLFKAMRQRGIAVDWPQRFAQP
jgi:predicted YcjX-like family ATPase